MYGYSINQYLTVVVKFDILNLIRKQMTWSTYLRTYKGELNSRRQGIDRVWALHVLVFRCTRYEYSHSCLTIMPNMPNGMLCTW